MNTVDDEPRPRMRLAHARAQEHLPERAAVVRRLAGTSFPAIGATGHNFRRAYS